jgi:hypothetical protein
VQDFSLSQAVADALESTDLASPDEIAEYVAANVGSRQVRAALAQALPPFVATMIQRRRSTNMILDPSQAPKVEDEPVAKQPFRSLRVSAIRDAWAKALADRVHVDGGYKMFGECTYDDLVFAAEERQEHARRNAAKATQYRAVADRLKRLGLETVSELPQGDSVVLAAVAAA